MIWDYILKNLSKHLEGLGKQLVGLVKNFSKLILSIPPPQDIKWNSSQVFEGFCEWIHMYGHVTSGPLQELEPIYFDLGSLYLYHELWPLQ